MFRLRSVLPYATILGMLSVGLFSVRVGHGLIASLMATLLVVFLSLVSYAVLVDVIKSRIRDASEPFDCSEIDYRIRVVCKLLGVEAYITSSTGLFGIAVLPPSIRHRKPVIFITRLTTKLLPKDAVEGIIAHELGHVIRRHHLIMATTLTFLFLIQTLATHYFTLKVGWPVLIVPSTAIATLLTYLLFWIHRQLEFEADRIAMKLVGEEKIMKSLKSVGAFYGVKAGIFDTHPSIDERIDNLELATLNVGNAKR